MAEHGRTGSREAADSHSPTVIFLSGYLFFFVSDVTHAARACALVFHKVREWREIPIRGARDSVFEVAV
jgi:hypothetical protein